MYSPSATHNQSLHRSRDAPATRLARATRAPAPMRRCAQSLGGRLKRWPAILWICAVGAFQAVAELPTDVSPEEELRRVCQTALCRSPFPIRLKLPNGEQFESTFSSPLPILAGDLITVFPGETINVEARVKDNRLVDLTAVSNVREPDRTLVFSLKQEPTIGDGAGMILKVESPFTGVLKYRLGMMLPSGDNLLKTSSWPLHEGIPVIEHWPYPIFQIVATDFELVDPESSAASTCE